MNPNDHVQAAALKPCPFCGGNAERQDIPTVGSELGNDPNAGGSFISCERCGASSPIHFDRKENLYSSWNDRASRATPADPALDAATAQPTDDEIRVACNAYGGSTGSCEFEWMRDALKSVRALASGERR